MVLVIRAYVPRTAPVMAPVPLQVEVLTVVPEALVVPDKKVLAKAVAVRNKLKLTVRDLKERPSEWRAALLFTKSKIDRNIYVIHLPYLDKFIKIM